jgi:hypothetical protein
MIRVWILKHPLTFKPPDNASEFKFGSKESTVHVPTRKSRAAALVAQQIGVTWNVVPRIKANTSSRDTFKITQANSCSKMEIWRSVINNFLPLLELPPPFGPFVNVIIFIDILYKLSSNIEWRLQLWCNPLSSYTVFKRWKANCAKIETIDLTRITSLEKNRGNLAKCAIPAIYDAHKIPFVTNYACSRP